MFLGSGDFIQSQFNLSLRRDIMDNKKINPKATKKAILEKIKNTDGYIVNTEKFNKRSNDENFLIKAAKLVEVEVVYTN